MTGWRQAVFVRQRRIDVIQRALSRILDEESWSPAVPRRLHIAAADASSRGWTMILPELANFFLDRGSAPSPRLCRLARELRCPVYEIDVRNTAATTLFEVDGMGRLRISGSPHYRAALAPRSELGSADPEAIDLGAASPVVGFGLLPVTDEIRARIDALRSTEPTALADYLGALAGFPAWTQLGDDAIAAGELVYEPPRLAERAPGRGAARTPEPGEPGESEITTPLARAGLSARRSETRAAIARSTPRAGLSSHDRRGTRPRSAARPRR
jgi:hypothetical protein